MKTLTVKHIGVLSVAKLMGAIYGCIGVLIGAVFAFISLLGVLAGAATKAGGGAEAFGLVFGIGAIVLFPILYGGMGFLSGAITALLYNFFAGWFGGVEVELSEGRRPPFVSEQSLHGPEGADRGDAR